MKKVIRFGAGSKSKNRTETIRAMEAASNDLNGRVELIQMLIPLGLRDVHDELQDEVRRLVGERHSRQSPGIGRWGKNPGSVYLGDQKILIEVPRVRNTNDGCEVPLQSYQALQNPRVIDHAVLARMINGLSSRKYERAALTVPETFGIRRNSVSRRFIRATARQLKKLMERDLSQEDIVAIFIDGKSLGELEVVIALGITIEGKKLVLGFIETSTENARVCKEFLSGLVQRGLKMEEEILFIIDGAKGIRKAITDVIGAGACVQRCQWHKRENVVSYLDKKHQGEFRGKLQDAYDELTYDVARQKLMNVRQELKRLNVSAVASLDEGLEETLTLHRLGVFSELGTSFKTTNCIESLNSMVGQYTGRVTSWKNSDQRQRWVASALLEVEPWLRRVKGHRLLKKLRLAMKQHVVCEAKAA